MLARIMAGAVVVGLMTHVALAQTVAEQDLEFARKAAEGGLMEVQFGELAQEQAKDEQVVQFGERMVQDHGEANEKLKAIAEQKWHPAAAGASGRRPAHLSEWLSERRDKDRN